MAEKNGDHVSEYSLENTKKKGAQVCDAWPSDSQALLDYSHEEKPLYRRMIDSFKPYDFKQDKIDTSKLSETDKIIYVTSRHPLIRRINVRYLRFIAFGGLIGTGLFIGSGNLLSNGGPAGQLIAYSVVGFGLLCVVNALAEMAVEYPICGSFNVLFSRFVDPSWGFTLGLLYAFLFAISFPLGIVACLILVRYWNLSISTLLWIAIFYVLIFLIHFFGVKGFGEAELALSALKVLAVIGFIIVGICLICGAGNGGYIGVRYWHSPGALNHGFKGVCLSFLSAAFTFGGIELVLLGSAETGNPRRSLPRTIKHIFWSIIFFYLATSVIIGFLVPYTDARLRSGNSSDNITASPFVIAINNSGIRVLPDIINAVILLSVVSGAITSVYATSRTLTSLVMQGFLPKWIGYVDRMGRPLGAILVSNIFGLLGFLATRDKMQLEVFTWLYAICSLGVFLNWIAICFTHIRFRWALNRQARLLDEVLYISPTGVWGSVCGIAILTFAVIGQIWTSIFPIGLDGASIKIFCRNCLALPVIIILWAGYKTYKKSWGQLMVDCQHVDLDAGRRDLNIVVIKQEVADEKIYGPLKPFWDRVYMVFCGER